MTMQSPAEAEHVASRTLDRRDYERFLPLVRRTAIRFARKVPRHITVGDLVAYGWVGLLEARKRATPGMPDNEFEAYAMYRVRGAILDYLRSLDPTTREVRNSSRKVTTAIRDLTRSLGRAPETAEIAQALGLSEDAYGATLQTIGKAGMARLEMLDLDDIDVHAAGEGVDDEAARSELQLVVAGAIPKLPVRLQQILALYYQEECTLKEIGAVLGVTESRVSQLHTEAVHRLRAAIGKL
jgi:RNA polymerase sigma factor for flagellar operon FliA